MPIKAIETRYKGYRFRSRLEARWAVFFDALKIRWEYEPEGFELGGGLRYLPDFKLPDDGRFPDMWLEVKPDVVIARNEIDKVWSFAAQLKREARNVGVLVFRGEPYCPNGFITGMFGGVEISGLIDDVASFINVFAPKAGTDAAGVADAALAARSARFEFGESGACV